MDDYFVTVKIAGIQAFLVSDCKSKAEAIRKAMSRGDTPEDVVAVDFNITDVYPSTARAVKDLYY